MSKRDRTEEALDQLSALHGIDDPFLLADELKKFLADRSNLVVARAARFIRENHVPQLIPELVASFERLMKDAPRLDKRCAGVTEIVMSLYEKDYREPDVYLKGIEHVQMEASFGPPVDTAAALRGISAQGLLRTGYPHALKKAVQLLIDDWAPARIGAVRALAANGGDAGTLVLRHKALVGDKDGEVTAECFAGLLAAEREQAVDFVAAFAQDGGDAAETALLALGESGLPTAIDFLRSMWPRAGHSPIRKTLLLALAVSRNEDAVNFLMALLDEAPLSAAAEIINALAIHKNSERVRRSVSEAVDRRRERELLEAYRREFAQ